MARPDPWPGFRMVGVSRRQKEHERQVAQQAEDLATGQSQVVNNIEINGALNHDGGTVGLYGTTPVSQGAALTSTLTTVTFSEPGTPDYAIADLTQTTPYGFVSSDEAQTVLKVIANLQTRVNELEARLDSSTGIGAFT